MAILRVQVNYEECPDSDWLDQWDTPEKYYGGAPDCPTCGCGMDYEKDHTWLCDECGRDDEVVRLEWEGNDKGGQCRPVKDEPILAFDEYKRTWGNPDNHVYLYAVVESKCDHCGEWGVKDSLGGIDFYEPAPDHWETGTFTEAEVDAMTKGYFRDELLGMLENVKETIS